MFFIKQKKHLHVLFVVKLGIGRAPEILLD